MTPNLSLIDPALVGVVGSGSACTYESLGTYTGWTFTGDYAITGTVIQSNCDVGTGNNGSSSWYEIGSSNISETAWIMRWVWNLQAVTQSGGTPAVIGCGLYSLSASAGASSSSGGNWSPTQELAVIFASAESGQRYFQTCTGSNSTNFYGTTTRSNLVQDQSFDDIYYMQIQRHDVGGTDTLSYSYTDQPDWSSLTTETIDNATYMPSNLAFVKCESWQYSGAAASGIDSTVSDFKFNNDSSDPCV